MSERENKTSKKGQEDKTVKNEEELEEEETKDKKPPSLPSAQDCSLELVSILAFLFESIVGVSSLACDFKLGQSGEEFCESLFRYPHAEPSAIDPSSADLSLKEILAGLTACPPIIAR